MNTCRCGAGWTGHRVAHCGGCHRTFASMALFDRHRSPRGEHGTCLDPASITDKAGNSAMTLVDGRWRGPGMTADARVRLEAKRPNTSPGVS